MWIDKIKGDIWEIESKDRKEGNERMQCCKHVGYIKKINDEQRRIENYIKVIFYEHFIAFFASPN